MNKPLVMITGASAGIGQAAARAFSAAGHPLLLVARRADALSALDLPDSVCVAADVADRDALAHAVALGEARFGPVDCLVNNAGVSRLARLERQDPAHWRELLDTNVLGVLNGMQLVLPAMEARRHGTVINVSSIAGRKVYPQHDVYGGTKHFVHAVTEGARQSMAPHNVRVMVISPGVTRTDIEHTISDPDARAFWSAGRDEMGGGIDAEVVARTMVYAYQLPQDVILQEMTITATRQQY